MNLILKSIKLDFEFLKVDLILGKKTNHCVPLIILGTYREIKNERGIIYLNLKL